MSATSARKTVTGLAGKIKSAAVEVVQAVLSGAAAGAVEGAVKAGSQISATTRKDGGKKAPSRSKSTK
ncbi:MAG: hypothetical protein ABI539_02030 [Acidobacteriota bacterium]